MSESSLQSKLDAGQFVVTGELAPPKSASRELILKKARWMKDFDAVGYLPTDHTVTTVRLAYRSGSGSTTLTPVAHKDGF